MGPCVSLCFCRWPPRPSTAMLCLFMAGTWMCRRSMMAVLLPFRAQPCTPRAASPVVCTRVDCYPASQLNSVSTAARRSQTTAPAPSTPSLVLLPPLLLLLRIVGMADVFFTARPCRKKFLAANLMDPRSLPQRWTSVQFYSPNPAQLNPN